VCALFLISCFHATYHLLSQSLCPTHSLLYSSFLLPPSSLAYIESRLILPLQPSTHHSSSPPPSPPGAPGPPRRARLRFLGGGRRGERGGGRVRSGCWVARMRVQPAKAKRSAVWLGFCSFRECHLMFSSFCIPFRFPRITTTAPPLPALPFRSHLPHRY
jgi:hypothetical protein